MKIYKPVADAKWSKVNHTNTKNNTTNSTISEAMFKRECKEYDEGTLIVCRDLYMGERYGVSVVG